MYQWLKDENVNYGSGNFKKTLTLLAVHSGGYCTKKNRPAQFSLTSRGEFKLPSSF
jgi:hypothetical protein